MHYHLLARGALDAVIESDVNILDIAALTVIVREAGGTFTDLDRRGGGTLATTSVLASNAPLHAPLLPPLLRDEHAAAVLAEFHHGREVELAQALRR